MVDAAPDVWTVYAYDLNTNTLITDLPATELEFDSRLNEAGSISFTLDISVPAVASLCEPILQYEGRPFAVYVDRNGVLVWGGIVWTGTYKRSGGGLQVTGKEFESYFSQRLAVVDYSVLTYPSGLDPAQLMYKIFTDAQNPALAGAGSSIGLTVISNSTGLPTIAAGYPLSQYTLVEQIASDLTQINVPGIGGLDIQITPQWVSGVPTNTLRIWTPRVGNAAGVSGVAFDLTAVDDFSWTTDATKSGTTLIVTGSGNGAAMPVQQTNAPGVPVGALGQSPRLDKVISTTAQSQDQVVLMANGVATQYGKPVASPTVTLLTNDPSTPLGTWNVGDDALLSLPPNVNNAGDPRFPNGLQEYWRIVQQSVTVPNEGLSKVVLTFNTPPIY